MKNKRFTFLILVLLIATIIAGGKIISEKIKQLEKEVVQFNQKNREKDVMLKTLGEQIQAGQKELDSTKKVLNNTNQELEHVKQELVIINKALDIANRELEIANKELDIASRVLDTANKLLDSANKRIEALAAAPAPGAIQK